MKLGLNLTPDTTPSIAGNFNNIKKLDSLFSDRTRVSKLRNSAINYILLKIVNKIIHHEQPTTVHCWTMFIIGLVIISTFTHTWVKNRSLIGLGLSASAVAQYWSNMQSPNRLLQHPTGKNNNRKIHLCTKSTKPSTTIRKVFKTRYRWLLLFSLSVWLKFTPISRYQWLKSIIMSVLFLFLFKVIRCSFNEKSEGVISVICGSNLLQVQFVRLICWTRDVKEIRNQNRDNDNLFGTVSEISNSFHFVVVKVIWKFLKVAVTTLIVYIVIYESYSCLWDEDEEYSVPVFWWLIEPSKYNRSWIIGVVEWRACSIKTSPSVARWRCIHYIKYNTYTLLRKIVIMIILWKHLTKIQDYILPDADIYFPIPYLYPDPKCYVDTSLRKAIRAIVSFKFSICIKGLTVRSTEIPADRQVPFHIIFWILFGI